VKEGERPLIVNILGTEYEISFKSEETDERLKDIAGYCNSYTKKIVIDKIGVEKYEFDFKDAFAKETLRHEIVHAFLSESGLKFDGNVWNGSWAKNEEMVDWIAIQFPKILKAFQETDCL